MSSNNPQEDPKPSPAVLSQELESFRRQWKEDLKTHKPEGVESASRKAGSSQPAAAAGAVSTAGKSRAESHTHRRRLSQQSARDELRGQAATAAVRKQLDHLDDGAQSHDLEVTIAKSTLLEDPSGGRVLGTSAPREPATALDYYEDAVEQERAGRQDEGLRLYRRAFKMDPKVQEKYKEKRFPKSSEKAPDGSSTTPAVPAAIPEETTDNLPPIMQLINSCVSATIIPGKEVNLAALKSKQQWGKPPPCPISTVPAEILLQIFSRLALSDVASFVRCARVCKAFCYIVHAERHIWKSLCKVVYDNQIYGPKWKIDLQGNSLLEEEEEEEVLTDENEGSSSNPVPSLSHLALDELQEDGAITPEEDETSNTLTLPHRPVDEVEQLKYGGAYKSMFILRPRIRFNGLYISTCTYHRPGHSVNSNLTLAVPMHMVTYYRYLRFYPSGLVLSLLTIYEPTDVVHSITLDNYHALLLRPQSTTTTSVVPQHSVPVHLQPIKGMVSGRWRIVFNPLKYATSSPDSTDDFSRIQVEIEGSPVIGKYTNTMDLSLKMRPKGVGGRRGFGDRLNWNSYSTLNRLTDDRADFQLKNDKPFYFSRVKAYEKEEGSTVGR